MLQMQSRHRWEDNWHHTLNANALKFVENYWGTQYSEILQTIWSTKEITSFLTPDTMVSVAEGQ